MFGKSLWIALVVLNGSPPSAGERSDVSPGTLVAIEKWFARTPAPAAGEEFGDLVSRAARSHLGIPYDDSPQRSGPETLRVRVDRFNCVSLIEYADAVARCAWRRSTTPECFLREVEQSRYRGGEMSDYASRLHYFVDWLGDNEQRGRLRRLDDELSAVDIREPFFFMTEHASRYPALADAGTRAAILAAEERLSRSRFMYVPRERIRKVQSQLRAGDILAFVTRKPGLLVTHTGLVTIDGRDRPRVLHASKRNDGVVLSRGDVADYITRRPERLGVIVARPIPPKDSPNP